MKLNQALLPLALCLSAPALLSAVGVHAGGDGGSWPQWRGPMLNGCTTETAWTSEGKAESLWETEVGLGYSSVTLADGRLYTMGFLEDEKMDFVWCLDPETGEEIWTHVYPSKIWNQFHGGGTLTTPTIDGDVVFVMNREANLFCLDSRTGDVLWHRDLKEELDVEYPTWGFSGSPLVLGDELLINVGPILSLDKETGKTKWTSKDYGHAYSTPAGFAYKGEDVLAVFNGAGLVVIRRKDGSEIASHEWKTQYDVNASTPIVVDDAIFISSGYNHGGALMALSDEGLTPVWETNAMKTHMSGCVLIGDYLYGFDESVLKCYGLDGEEKWAERGLGKGALMASPERLLMMSGKGELVVAKVSPDGYTELSKTKVIDDGGVFWTKPVLVDGIVYCRSSNGTLVARDHRAEK